MEVEVVMVGPTFNIGQLVAVPTAAPPPPPPPCIFINAEGDNDPDVEESGGVSLISSMIGSPSEKSPDYSSDSSSSSIGAPSDDDDEEDEEEDNTVSSKGALASLDSIEESLPFKKGLSNHFSGKSKSFGNLSDMGCCTEVSKMKDVEKAENPFNKRRRILMANKLFNSARKSSFYGWSNNPKSMPVLAALDELEEDEKELGARYGGDHGSSSSSSSSSLMSPSKQLSEHQDSVESSNRRFKSGLGFKSQSCFALSDLQEEDDDDDHDHD